jgi:hypothetical protein
MNATVTPLPVPAPQPAQVDTPSWLLMGPGGTGKTHSLITLLKAGIEVFHLASEPDAVSVVMDQIKKQNLDVSKYHYHVIRTAGSGMKSLIDMATKVKNLDYEGITKLNAGIGKDKQTQFIELLNTIAKFVDDRTGVDYGDATSWGPDRAFIIDSMSGLNYMAWKLVVGLRPTASQGEWNIAQNLVFDLLMELTATCKCFFIVLAHIEREVDEITGGTKITVSSLGRKLAPRLPPIFSEVILSVRVGTAFTWSNISPQTDLKARTLPWADNLPPDFAPLVRGYHERIKFAAVGSAATKP